MNMHANLNRALSVSIFDLALDAACKVFLLLLVALVVASLAKKLSAAVRHRIWCYAFCGVVVLPLISITFPQWNCAVLPAQPAAKANAPADTGTPGTTQRVGRESVAERESRRSTSSDALDGIGRSGIGAATPAGNDRASGPVERSSVAAESVRRLTSLEALLLVGWGLGAAFFLAPLILGMTASRVFFTNCRTVHHGRWIDLLAENCSRLRVARRVRIVETEDPIVPMTYGLFRPVLLVPESSRAWTDDRRRIVLLHELAHIKRLDVPWQINGRLACSLYWFNPLAWYALRRLRMEQELACDDCVLTLGEKASEYAAQLVELARTYRSSRVVFGVSAARSSTLERRIVSLLDPARAHGPLSKPLAFTLVIWSLALITAIAVVRPIARAEDKRGTVEAVTANERPDETPTIAADVGQKSSLVGTHFIRGTVEDPQAKPIAGARVWLQRYCAGGLRDERLRSEEKPNTDIGWSEWIAVAQTDARGAFRLDVDPQKLLVAAKKTHFSIQLAATADGFGFGLAPLETIDEKRDESARVTIRTADDLPIEGRLLTSDGKPAQGASVQLLWILRPNQPSLDRYIRAIKSGLTYSFRSDEVVPIPGLSKVGVVDPWGRQPNALTDQDGRFVLRGIGRERIVRMMIWGASIDLSAIVVATRQVPVSERLQNVDGILHEAGDKDDKSVSLAGGFSVSAFGFVKSPHQAELNHYYARFSLRSVPVRTLRGLVRDRDTGRPVAGAKVSGPNYPSTTKEDGRFEMTACPKQAVYQILVNTSSGRYLNMSMPLEDTPGITPIEFNIDLPKGITARGLVTERESGKPVSGIVEYDPLYRNPFLDRFGLNRGSTQGVIPRSTSLIAADGTYELQVLPGPGVIVVRAKGYYTDRIPWPRHDVYAVPRFDLQRLKEVLGEAPSPGIVNTEDIIHLDSGQGFFGTSRAGSRAVALIRPEVRETSLTQNLQVVRGRDVQGIVLDPDGKPISQVMVRGLSPDPVLNIFLSDEKFTANCVSPDEPRRLVFRHRERHLEADVQIPKGYAGVLTVRLKQAQP